MILPAADRAYVDPGKLRGYLLAPDNPKSRGKVRAFVDAGYSAKEWQLLADHLKQLARFGLARPGRVSVFGEKYEVDGILRSPNGGSLGVRTIWIVRPGEDFPRFVTAYPRRQR